MIWVLRALLVVTVVWLFTVWAAVLFWGGAECTVECFFDVWETR